MLSRNTLKYFGVTDKTFIALRQKFRRTTTKLLADTLKAFVANSCQSIKTKTFF